MVGVSDVLSRVLVTLDTSEYKVKQFCFLYSDQKCVTLTLWNTCLSNDTKR
jgi:hypothetical protein